MKNLQALPHQERVADNVEQSGNNSQLLYHTPGSGKTFSSIHAADRVGLPIMAVVPAALRNNYKKEMDAAGNPVPSSVMSYQQAVNQMQDPAFRERARNSMLVIDEAHRLGQVDSTRSQLATDLPSRGKLLMTATPIRNKPHELAPLINAINPGSVPNDPVDFDKQFLARRKIPVGFWGMLRGDKPGVEYSAKNLDQLATAVRGKVDYYDAVDRSNFPSFSETIHEIPMSKKQQAAYDYVLGKYPSVAYKIKHGIPTDIDSNRDMNAFFNGPRQVSNHPAAFNASATDADAPKFTAAADEIQQRYKADPNFRGVVYSTYINSGVDPMSRVLKARGIPHATFTGGMSDAERAGVVKNYNNGSVPIMILSGAGAEGLDLKGTKLMQILEPHWNEELIDQVRGRAIRYKSHSHLPEAERHVDVQRFHTVPAASSTSFWDKYIAQTPKSKGVDDYLYQLALRKRALNSQFLDVLKQEGSKTAAVLHVAFSSGVPRLSNLLPPVDL